MTEQGKFIRVPEEMWFDDRLTGTEKLVLISLLCHLNHEQRRSWPSQGMIAKECGLSRKWVRATLRELEQRGYIDSFKEKGRGNQMIYALNPLPPRKEETETELPVTGTECRKEISSQFTDRDAESRSNENSVPVSDGGEKGTQFPLLDTEKWELSSEKGELSSPLMGTQFPSKGNSVPTNQIKNQINNQIK
ncbi:MAG: helix-turn-helix domain-containing protein, partial [Pyramidobacter sp.]|nr:helix-turn-helix domain-containing protein [Pyramidobacter sp.]